MKCAACLVFFLLFLAPVHGQWKTISTRHQVASVPVYAVNKDFLLAAATDSAHTHHFERTSDGTYWDDLYPRLAAVSHGGIVASIGAADSFVIAEVINDSEQRVFTGLYRSTDNGSTWNRAGYSGFSRADVRKFYTFGELLIAVTDAEHVLISRDRGDIWEDIFPGERLFESIIGAGIAGEKLFIAASNNSTMYPDAGFYFSSDTGKTWDSVSGIFGTRITAAAPSGESIFISGGGMIYRSVVEDYSWENITNDSIPPFIEHFAFDGKNVFAAKEPDKLSGRKIFWSPDYGEHWREYTDNLRPHRILDLFTFDNFVFVISDSAIWRRPLLEFSEVRNSSSDFSISVFPNPSNGVGNLSYNLPESSPIKIQIYNLTGQLIETVADGYQSEGRHEVGFDLSAQAVGEYFISLRTETSSKVLPIRMLR